MQKTFIQEFNYEIYAKFECQSERNIKFEVL